jgi:beta-lactamase superfamily II metal-dependent hydrolase
LTQQPSIFQGLLINFGRNPWNSDYGIGTIILELHNYYAVLKLTCGSNSFLFEGDTDELSEKNENSGYNLDSDVLKIGHHGSATSSTTAFLANVTPEYAIISVGKDNTYGHP